MKYGKTAALLLAVSLCLEAPVAVLAADSMPKVETKAVKTKKKQGLKKEKGKYYYYHKGKKLKNKWKVIRVNGKACRFYFGKTGAAYAGKKVDGKEAPLLKRIKGAYYAFDSKGRMLKGVQVIQRKFYVFSSKTGKLNRSASNQLRKASKYNGDYDKLKKQLSVFGKKPVKTEWYGFSCQGDGEDGTIYYKGFTLAVYKDTSGKIFINAVISE